MSKSVLISGIGIAGPTLAYWLSAWGYRPTLTERAAAPRTDGYIIDFWGLGYDIAERMGLLPALTEQGYHVRELRFVDDRGRRMSGFGVDVFRALTGGRYVSLPRGELAKLIFDRIDGRCEIIFGDSITGLEDSGDTVQGRCRWSPLECTQTDVRERGWVPKISRIYVCGLRSGRLQAKRRGRLHCLWRAGKAGGPLCDAGRPHPVYACVRRRSSFADRSGRQGDAEKSRAGKPRGPRPLSSTAGCQP